MSPQDIILGLVGVVSAGLGWWMKDIWEAHKQLRSELNELKQDLPEKYVQRSDFKEDLTEIKATLKEIFAELRRKQDRAHLD